MDARLQRRIQRYGWDKAAAYYEQAWQRQLAPAQTTMLALAALAPGERVVDVACGTGLVSFAAADAVGQAGMVVGTDISEAMVTLAAARARSRGLNHVRFARLDAEDMSPLDSASFDVALCGLGLMYVPDALNAVREMVRLVDRGGRILAAVWGQRSRCGWAEIFPIVDAQVQSEVCPLFFGLGGGDRLAEVFREAGLEDVVTQRLETRLEWTSDDDACGAAFVGGPVALAYSRFDARKRSQVRREYLDSIARWRIANVNARAHTDTTADASAIANTNGHAYGDDHAYSYSVPGEFVIVAGHRPAS